MWFPPCDWLFLLASPTCRLLVLPFSLPPLSQLLIDTIHCAAFRSEHMTNAYNQTHKTHKVSEMSNNGGPKMYSNKLHAVKNHKRKHIIVLTSLKAMWTLSWDYYLVYVHLLSQQMSTNVNEERRRCVNSHLRGSGPVRLVTSSVLLPRLQSPSSDHFAPAFN